MDNFEHIRGRAAFLHSQLVGKGADASNPISLINAALTHFDMEVIWLSHGDPALKNAKALFDEQLGTIFCEDQGTDADKALLVAHEIGHAELHAGSSQCSSQDVDLSRSIEAASVGMQRVEDYGAKERRELHANVFARELLFPRAAAKEFFLEQGLSASDIQARVGLPINVIRQQLFDALLLPNVPDEIVGDKEFIPIEDASQDRAVAHRASAFQLQAGPGTGKTRTLIKRVKSLVDEGVDPSSILILTFSNRAAGELTERLLSAVPGDASKIWVGTFHAFGLDLVRRYYDRLGLPSDPKLFDRSDAINILEEILPTLPLKHYRNLWDPALVLREIINAFSRAKDELIDSAQYHALAEAMLEKAGADGDAIKAAQKCLEVAAIYDIYEQATQERGAVDFGDLIMLPTLLLEQNKSIRVTTQLRHRHILVDEYQDVNRASARLLKAVAGDGRRLWVVGDARQSIYRFRGASSVNMTMFKDDYPNAAIDQLSINYRSKPEIVDAFTSVAPSMAASNGMLPLTLVSNEASAKVTPEVKRFENLTDEAGGVAASIKELESRGVFYRDQVVLCRTNARLNEVAKALELCGIPVLHLGSLFERGEIRDLLSILAFIVDPFGDALTRMAVAPRYGLSMQDVYVLSNYIKRSPHSALEELPSLAGIEGLSDRGVTTIKQLFMDFREFQPQTSPWEVLSRYMLDRTDVIRDLARSTELTDRMKAIAIWQFLNFTREQTLFGNGYPIQRLLDRVRQLVLLAEERDLRQVPTAALHINAVRLMTVHGSKGLEFEAVHIPGMTVSSFPNANRGQRCPPPEGMINEGGALSVKEAAKISHAMEEECLFFVAISRAKTHLNLYLSKTLPNGNKRKPSPYLELIPSHRLNDIETPPVLSLSKTAEENAHINVTMSANWKLSDGRITSFERCPLRFFYTHMLGLGQARKVTAFSKTHDSIYELLRWLEPARLTGEADLSNVKARFEEIWQTVGAHDHAFATDYKKIAIRIIEAMVRRGDDFQFQETVPLSVEIMNTEVMIQPDEVAHGPEGQVIVRRVRTGYERSDEYDRLEYTLYLLAVRTHFGPDASLRALHLTDDVESVVEIKTIKLDNRIKRCESIVQEITVGNFPPKTDSVTCPRCPHFFICGAVPAGPLQI